MNSVEMVPFHGDVLQATRDEAGEIVAMRRARS